MALTFNDRVWFNWQQPASPMLLGATIDACGQPFREFFGFPFFTSIVYYRTLENGRGYQASWLLRLDEGEACGRLLVDALSVPSFRSYMDSAITECFTAVTAAAQEIAQLDLPSLDDADFSAHFEQYYHRFVDFYRLGAITEPVQWHVERVFRDFVADARKEGSHLPAEWPVERLEAAAFSMTGEPYTLDIERSLVNVADALDHAYKSSSLDRDALESLDEAGWQQLWDTQPGLLSAASHHAQSYYWKTNNYRETHVVSPREVVLEILDIASDGAVADHLRSHVVGAEQRRKAMEADRARVLDLSPAMVRTVVQIGDQYGGRLADQRKATMLPALHAMDLLGREIARRTNVAYELVLRLTPAEVPAFVHKPSDYIQRLTDREQALVLVQAPFPLDDAEMSARLRVQRTAHHIGLPHKTDASLAEGTVALDVLTHLNVTMGFLDSGSEDEVVQGDVIVRPTSSSIIEGVCRIITDPRADKLDPGEILIATSTTPDFMPAMRHAKALLVDQGGVLSHAALTSRELGTPCIVGVSVATVRFRTGDVVRLDFDTGTATLATDRKRADV